jgi:hypothetical protein
MATYDNNCDRWSAGLEPEPVNLFHVDAGEIVAGILAQVADGEGTIAELEQACEDAAMLLGHPDVATALFEAALRVVAADHRAARGDA